MRHPPLDAAALRRCLAPFPEQARTLPAAAYTSPEVFAWEQEHFFEGSWVCVGRVADLGQPGDQRAVRIGVEGVLLVRDQAGALRAFANTCRHRGHELLPCGGPAVNRRAVQCPYHRWTYGLDGGFRGGPGMASQSGFDPSDPEHGLVLLRMDEWAGWAFVNCSGDAPSMERHLGGSSPPAGCEGSRGHRQRPSRPRLQP